MRPMSAVEIISAASQKRKLLGRAVGIIQLREVATRPFAAFTIGPVNERKARGSRLWLGVILRPRAGIGAWTDAQVCGLGPHLCRPATKERVASTSRPLRT